MATGGASIWSMDWRIDSVLVGRIFQVYLCTRASIREHFNSSGFPKANMKKVERAL